MSSGLLCYVEEVDIIRQCICCHDMEIRGCWVGYQGKLPDWAKEKVTGSICPDCFKGYTPPHVREVLR